MVIITFIIIFLLSPYIYALIMKNNDTTVPTDNHAGIDFNYSESQFVIQVDFEVHAGKHRARKYICTLYI